MKSLLHLSLVIVACSALGPQQASAQINSMYTNRLLNSYQRGNSVEAYTSQRFQNSVVNRVVPTYQFSNVNRNVLSSALPARQKPFSSVRPSNPVSPYLALDQPFQNTATTYYTQIRPMQEQERLNQQMAARSQQIQQQLNAIAAQGPYSPVGDAERAPTGHVSTFMNYGGYYTMPAPSF
jgi:hypothetical protein